MIERNGKFYVTLQFTDKDSADTFEEGMRNGGNIWASKARIVDPPTSVQNVNNSSVNGTLMQFGEVKGSIGFGGA